jgi:hypothetical protein
VAVYGSIAVASDAENGELYPQAHRPALAVALEQGQALLGQSERLPVPGGVDTQQTVVNYSVADVIEVHQGGAVPASTDFAVGLGGATLDAPGQLAHYLFGEGLS